MAHHIKKVIFVTKGTRQMAYIVPAPISLSGDWRRPTSWASHARCGVRATLLFGFLSRYWVHAVTMLPRQIAHSQPVLSALAFTTRGVLQWRVVD